MKKSITSDTNAETPKTFKERMNCQSRERRCENRRRKQCDGYVHLPAVGWYCRRLKTRRETDIYTNRMF